MLYCGMTRFRNIKLGVFRQYQNKNYFKNEKYWENRFKKLLKVQKFWLSNLTLTELNEGNKNSLKLDMSYSKELEQKMKML